MVYNVDKLIALDLGRQGENLARTIEIDVSSVLAQWPDAIISLLVKRKHDTEPYIAATEVIDSILRWPITAVETQESGDGKFEVRAICGDVVAKSATGTFRVSTSLTGSATEPPETEQAWVDQVLAAGAGIEESAARASEAADRAESAAEAADAAVDTAVKGIESDVQKLQSAIYEPLTCNLHRGAQANYAYVTSTFSGWVTEYTIEYDMTMMGIRTCVTARETALSKARVLVALDERTTEHVVFDAQFDVSVSSGTEQYLDFSIEPVHVSAGQTVFVGVAFDQICSQLFNKEKLTEYVSWYVTDGNLSEPIEQFDQGSLNQLWCQAVGFTDQRTNIDILNEKCAVIQEQVDENYVEITSQFDVRWSLVDEQDLIPLLPSSASWRYTTSTFHGWGAPIGSVQEFDALTFRIRNRSTNEGYIEKIRCFVTDWNKTGEVIADVLSEGWHIAPGEECDIVFALKTKISNSEGNKLWAGFLCDQYIDVWAGGTGVNLNAPDYGKVAYASEANLPIDIDALTAASMQNLYDPTLTNQIKPMLYAGMAAKQYLLAQAQLDQVLDAVGVTEPPRVILPHKFQAVAGDTLQLFYRGLIEHPDPYAYNIEVICDIGRSYPRYFEITPTAEQVGTHPLTLNLRDGSDRILATASTQIEVVTVGASPSENRTVLCIGDSLTSSGIWCAEVDRRLTGTGGSPAGQGLQNIEFIGSKSNGDTGYEGYGGWTWASYLSEPKTDSLDMWVMAQHDKTSDDQHSLWRDEADNVWQLETIEEDRLKLTRYEGHTGAMPTGAGKLEHVSNASHTSSISYISTYADGGNPFWDNATGKVSFKAYCERHGFSGIDYVYTLLTWNGNAAYRAEPEDNAVHAENARALLRILHLDYPDAQVKIMGIQMPSLNGGTGANYGANSGYSNAYGLCRTVMGLNLAYQALADEDEFNGWVEFVNVSGQFDSEYNMPQTNKQVNTRSTLTESVGTNGVHPSETGYLQIGDAAYRNMVARISEH